MNVSQNITLACQGDGEVHLSGYFEPNSSLEDQMFGAAGGQGFSLDDDEEDEDEQEEITGDELKDLQKDAKNAVGKGAPSKEKGAKDVVGFQKGGDLDKSWKDAKKNAVKNAVNQDSSDDEDDSDDDEDSDEPVRPQSKEKQKSAITTAKQQPAAKAKKEAPKDKAKKEMPEEDDDDDSDDDFEVGSGSGEMDIEDIDLEAEEGEDDDDSDDDQPITSRQKAAKETKVEDDDDSEMEAVDKNIRKKSQELQKKHGAPKGKKAASDSDDDDSNDDDDSDDEGDQPSLQDLLAKA